MQKFFAEPEVRLFLRALLVAAVTFASKFVVIGPSGIHVSYQAALLGAALTGAVLAFAEIFTPLNDVLGFFKLAEEKTAK